MTFIEDLGSLATKLTSGEVSDAQVHDAFDQTARVVPQSALADGLSHAFRSDQTPAFEGMVSHLYERSNPEQKAGFLNQLVGALGGTGALSSAGGLGALTGLLSGGNVTPQQAQQVSPGAVESLAKDAARKDPSIMEKAADFYAQHPTLVKAIGAGALAILMNRISANRR